MLPWDRLGPHSSNSPKQGTIVAAASQCHQQFWKTLRLGCFPVQPAAASASGVNPQPRATHPQSPGPGWRELTSKLLQIALSIAYCQAMLPGMIVEVKNTFESSSNERPKVELKHKMKGPVAITRRTSYHRKYFLRTVQCIVNQAL